MRRLYEHGGSGEVRDWSLASTHLLIVQGSLRAHCSLQLGGHLPIIPAMNSNPI